MFLDKMLKAIMHLPMKTGLIVTMKNGETITGIIDTLYEDDNDLDFGSEGYEEFYSCVIEVTEVSRVSNTVYQPGQLTEIKCKCPIEQVQLFDGTVIWNASEGY